MKKNIAERIKKAIEKGDIKMRTRTSVLTERWGIKGMALFLMGGLIFIIGFIFYWMYLNNDLLSGIYGEMGIGSYIRSFPYVLPLLFILIFGMLILILRKYDFSYKKPFILILVLIFIFISITALIFSSQPMGRRMYQQSDTYLKINKMGNNIVWGTVVSIENNKIKIETEEKGKVSVITTDSTHYPSGIPEVKDRVKIVGVWENQEFVAYGVRIFDENTGIFYGNGTGKGKGRMRNR